MYRIAATEPPGLPRPNADAIGARSAVVVAALSALALAASTVLREHASAPPPEIADRVALAIPLLLASLLAFASALAARVKMPARRLPHTHPSPGGYLGHFFVLALPIGFFEAILWTIAPLTWGAAWVCHSPRPGKTVCNFASGVSGWATAWFALGILPTVAGVVSLGLIVYEVVRAFRRATGGLKIEIDSDLPTPRPAEALTVDLALGGRARLDRVELRLERTATFRQGKSSTTTTIGAVTLVEASDLVVLPTAPVLLRGQGVAPERPHARSLGATSLGLRYVAEWSAAGAFHTETIDLVE